MADNTEFIGKPSSPTATTDLYTGTKQWYITAVPVFQGS